LRYLAYFPAAVFLGKLTGAQLTWGLVVQAVWIVLFAYASRALFQRGLQRYSGFGG
jgi:ABC-2 type transport system permease protein